MMGGAKAHLDGIATFSQTDFTEDLKRITIPTLVMHSKDDQIVPYVAAGPKSAELLQNGTLIYLPRFPTRHAHHARRRHQRRPMGIPESLAGPDDLNITVASAEGDARWSATTTTLQLSSSTRRTTS